MSEKTKKETLKVSAEELAKMVEREFIANADQKFLKKVLKTAKGGIRFAKTLKTEDKKFTLFVGSALFYVIPLKTVSVFSEEENKLYVLEKDKYWKAFYTAVKSAVDAKQA